MSKVVIITGASKGIGRAAAEACARAGSKVILVSRSKKLLEDITRRINEQGGDAIAIQGDVSKTRDCAHIISSCIEAFGQIDVLVNNAGILEPISHISQLDPQKWKNNWLVNVFGPIILSQMAIPYLRKSKGIIINVSSGASIEPVSGWSSYCTAKAAINQFTRSLALEEPTITSLALRPGIVDTEMQKNIRDNGQLGMPEKEYQEFVDFYVQGKLLSPQITGQVINILSLYASREWSGEYISWDDNRIKQLINTHVTDSV